MNDCAHRTPYKSVKLLRGTPYTRLVKLRGFCHFVAIKEPKSLLQPNDGRAGVAASYSVAARHASRVVD
jgi:hypothetical protein